MFPVVKLQNRFLVELHVLHLCVSPAAASICSSSGTLCIIIECHANVQSVGSRPGCKFALVESDTDIFLRSTAIVSCGTSAWLLVAGCLTCTWQHCWHANPRQAAHGGPRYRHCRLLDRDASLQDMKLATACPQSALYCCAQCALRCHSNIQRGPCHQCYGQICHHKQLHG